MRARKNGSGRWFGAASTIGFAFALTCALAGCDRDTPEPAKGPSTQAGAPAPGSPAGTRGTPAGTDATAQPASPHGPIDLARWRQTPCVKGRPATQADIDAGRAFFAFGSASTPLPLDLPLCALYNDPAAGEGAQPVPVVIIQAEQAHGIKQIAFRRLDGSRGICGLSDLVILDGPNERFKTK